MHCSICDKQFYGHKAVKSGQTLVCSSCALTKSADAPVGKDLSEVRVILNKLAKSQTVPIVREGSMNSFPVWSNVKNKVILIGSSSITFDENGRGLCPEKLREEFLREVDARPGRFGVVVESPVVVQSQSPVVEVIEESPEEVVELDLETPVTEESEEIEQKPKKKGRK